MFSTQWAVPFSNSLQQYRERYLDMLNYVSVKMGFFNILKPTVFVFAGLTILTKTLCHEVRGHKCCCCPVQMIRVAIM